MQRAWPAILLIAILVLGAVLRFWGLGLESMWQDEVDSVLTARLSMAALLTEPIGNKQPLYFVLLHFWSQIFGESETSVRFPSALMGLLTVAATYGLGSVVDGLRVLFKPVVRNCALPVCPWISRVEPDRF